jgi:signal transduction histidine kinase
VIDDSGHGVSVLARDRIFEPFFRDPGMRTRVSGFGLGLPLARSVVRALGGDIQLDNAYTSGSRFELRLPLHEA